MPNIIDKYGVPLPSGRNRVMVQPKEKNKFRVVVYNFGIDIDEKDYVAMNVETVDKPSISFSVNQAYMFDSNTAYAGKHNWKEMKIVMRDSVDNKLAKAISRQVQKQIDFQRRISDRKYQKYTGSYKFRMMIETTGGANPDDTLTNYGRDTLVDIASAISDKPALINNIDDFINGEGYNPMSTLDRWLCFGCIITDVDYGSMDYSSSQPATITMTVKPDNCLQYDVIKEMYSDRIRSLFFSDDVNKALNIMDELFGNVPLW